MAHDVLIVGQKLVIRKIPPPLRVDIDTKGVVEASNVVLVEALQLRRFQLVGKVLKFGRVEKAK